MPKRCIQTLQILPSSVQLLIAHEIVPAVALALLLDSLNRANPSAYDIAMEQLASKRRIIREYRIQYPRPLCAAAGDSLTVGREDDQFPGWKWCKAPAGCEGWVPKELLSDPAARETTILCDYSSRELAVQPGEEVTVEDSRYEWLLVRNKQGERGWIPACHAESWEESDRSGAN